MPASPTDRRISRTQLALQEALLSLTLQMDYEAITVEDLCEHANVGRSTFYEHFRGKDDLKRSGIAAFEAEFVGPPSEGRLFSFSLPLLQHAKAHLKHIRALGTGRGRDVAMAAVTALVRKQIGEELGREEPAPASTDDLEVRFYTGAFMSVLTGWLDSGAHLAAEDVDAVFRRLVVRAPSS